MEQSRRNTTSSRAALSFINMVMGRVRIGIVLTTLVETVYSVCCVYSALSLRTIINTAVAGESRQFLYAVAIFSGIVCIQILCGAGKCYGDEAIRTKLENRFKSRLFDRLLQGDYASVSAVHSGEWMNRLTSDAVLVANTLTELVPRAVGMIVKMVGAIVMIAVLQPAFLYLIVPGGVLILVLSSLFRRVTKQLHRDIQEKDGKLRTFLQENLECLMVLRSYGVEASSLAGADMRMENHRFARMKKNFFLNMITVGYHIAMNGIYVLGAAFSGYGILKGTMSYGDFSAMLQLISQVQSPMSEISGYMPWFYSMLASAERLMEAEAMAGKRTAASHTLPAIRGVYEKGFECIGLRQADFTYQPPISQPTDDKSRGADRPPVLNQVNMEIRKGEFIAFTGSSGCGKSTIFKLLMCLYSLNQGERYIRINGKEIPLDASWQKLFAYVPQGNHLMSGTIQEIVALADQGQMQ